MVAEELRQAIIYACRGSEGVVGVPARRSCRRCSGGWPVSAGLATLLGALVGGGFTILGVLTTSFIATRREHRQELWQRRAETYEGAVALLLRLQHDRDSITNDASLLANVRETSFSAE